MKAKLHVKQTNNKQLLEKWGFNPAYKGDIYIRCNKKGVVNYNSAPVYSLCELLLRGNVVLLRATRAVLFLCIISGMYLI